MAQNQEWVLQKYPEGPVTADCFALRSIDSPQPGPGQVLLRVLYISVDPYLRIKLYPKKAEAKEDEEPQGEFAPFVIGEALSSPILGEVVQSNSPKLEVGDRVSGFGPWKTLTVLDADQLRKVPNTLPLSSYLNVTGLIGLSTYFPVTEIGQPKPGEVVFVSGAGGAVGTLAGQLFKAFGCRVIGSTGSDNKVETLRSIGFDAAFNYKSKSTEEALDELAPGGIDIYWDNVGGAVLDAALARMTHGGRIIACGSISQYDKLGSDGMYRLQNYFNIVTKCIKYQGFISFEYASRQDECFQKLTRLVLDGKLKPMETVYEGFDKVPAAFVGLFAGDNVGKMLIKVADPSPETTTQAQQQHQQQDERVKEQEGTALAALRKEVEETRELVVLSKGRAHEALEGLLRRLEQEVKAKESAASRPAAAPVAASTGAAGGAAQPKPVVSKSSVGAAGGAGKPMYTPIESFGWDQGEYGSKYVSVYVTLEGVGEVKDQVACDFTKDSFDLKVHGLNGRNYRLFKDNLDKEIVPEESKAVVKKNRVTVQLKKVKGEFSYDHWTDLTAKRPKGAEAKGSSSSAGGADPMGGIMDLMKNLYEEGDDNMKRIIGESMMKAQRGEKQTTGGGLGAGLGGLPSFDDDSSM